MKAVILESYALREGDLDWAPVRALVEELTVYPRTAAEEVILRLADADFAIVNKHNINEAVLRACPRLRWVGLIATGYDSLDAAACRRRGIPVANVPGYSTDSVAQTALALLLELCQSAGTWDAAVRAGCWQLDAPARYAMRPLRELAGKTLGVVGYGAIGRRMAALGAALGMRVVCATRTPRPDTASVRFVPFDALWPQCDVISLHCPATPETVRLVRAETLALCRPGVLLLNTARGALVDEAALAAALVSGQAGGYGSDVFLPEPLAQDSPLRTAPHTVFTPHIGWATPEALARLSACVAENLSSFLAGNPQNVIN